MSLKSTSILFLIIFIQSCAPITKNTIQLSKALGEDIRSVHVIHRNSIRQFYKKINDGCAEFIDLVYIPYLLNQHAKNQKVENKLYSEEHYKEHSISLNKKASDKREELLVLIRNQETEYLNSISQFYEQLILTNSLVTTQLEISRKPLASQKQVRSFKKSNFSEKRKLDILSKTSLKVNELIMSGKKIEINSEDAGEKIEEKINQIKKLIRENY